MAFVKDDPAKAASLVANIQKLTEANKAKDLRSFVVFMGGPEMKGALEKAAADKKITIAMSFLPSGAGQGDINRYKINPEAKNTVLVYRRQQVTATFVNVDDKSFEEVAKATAAMLGN
jgi:hypothetical protein